MFLGRDIAAERDFSEDTAATIDAEVSDLRAEGGWDESSAGRAPVHATAAPCGKAWRSAGSVYR